MSETITANPTNGFSVSPDALRSLLTQINEIDSQLDAASGSNASTERVAVDSLLNEQSENYKAFVDSIVENISGADDQAARVATVIALEKVLSNKYGKEVKDFVAARAESVKNQQEQSDLTNEELQELEATRKTLVEQYKAIRQLLEMFDADIDDIDEPKIRRGSRGPRGPRTLNTFQYTVNQTELPEQANSLAMVAKMTGFDKVKELKEVISKQGVNLKKPGDEWQADLGNGNVLYAKRLPEYVGMDDSEESDDSDSEGTDEEE